MAGRANGRPCVTVFAPSPLLTITIEPAGADPELHLHAGGQGVWVARMAAALGARVELCAALGGETGRVLRALLDDERFRLRAVASSVTNGAYLHDRRDGQRREIAETPSRRLPRHDADELYGTTVTTGLESDITLLTGPWPPTVLDADAYRRLARDLRCNRRRAIADLSGEALRGALAGGVELVKLSVDEVVAGGWASDGSTRAVLEALERLRAAGARSTILTRGPDPAFALVDGRLHELTGPRFEALEPRGSGDAMFAALGVALAAGQSVLEALRLGVAAGALNATRRGLGTGHRAEVERLAPHVRVRELGGSGT